MSQLSCIRVNIGFHFNGTASGGAFCRHLANSLLASCRFFPDAVAIVQAVIVFEIIGRARSISQS